jgi:hypothetical protein
MKHAGLTVLLVFFAISVLDAFDGGSWLRILFWIGVGLIFWGLERERHRPAPIARGPAHR